MTNILFVVEIDKVYGLDLSFSKVTDEAKMIPDESFIHFKEKNGD